MPNNNFPEPEIIFSYNIRMQMIMIRITDYKYFIDTAANITEYCSYETKIIGYRSKQTYRGNTMARILAVDDSAVIREMVDTILSAEGHEVVTAEDGVDALDKARNEVFEIVLSDVNMPKMNGIRLVTHLRKLPGYEFVPIVMVTTENSEQRKNKAKTYGATGWLVKPFTPERLIGAVSKLTN